MDAEKVALIEDWSKGNPKNHSVWMAVKLAQWHLRTYSHRELEDMWVELYAVFVKWQHESTNYLAEKEKISPAMDYLIRPSFGIHPLGTHHSPWRWSKYEMHGPVDLIANELLENTVHSTHWWKSIPCGCCLQSLLCAMQHGLKVTVYPLLDKKPLILDNPLRF